MARTPPQRRLDRHDHDDGLLGDPGLVGGRRLPALGWTGIVIAFAGVVLVVNNSLNALHALVRQPRRHADLDAGGLRLGALCRALRALQLRLGALRVMAWTTLIGALVLLPMSLAFDFPREFGRLDDRAAGLLALHGDLPRGRGLPGPHAPASTGWG